MCVCVGVLGDFSFDSLLFSKERCFLVEQESPKECHTRVSHKIGLQECPTKALRKSVSYRSVAQECLTKMSRKTPPACQLGC